MSTKFVWNNPRESGAEYSTESENVEEYLETIYRITEKGGRPTTTAIAGELGVSAPSVSEMLRKLDNKGYLRYEPYGGAVLTAKGKAIGKTVLRKHRLMERFLIAIGISKNKVHNEACRLEHAVSKDLESAIKKEIGETRANSKGMVSLADMKPGQKGEVVSIDSGELAKRRLEDMGLTPGAEISVSRTAPLGGPVEIRVRGSSLAIGRGMAQKIYLKVDG
jgi:DtxR family Mn-dependent transcriptional regulator